MKDEQTEVIDVRSCRICACAVFLALPAIPRRERWKALPYAYCLDCHRDPHNPSLG